MGVSDAYKDQLTEGTGGAQHGERTVSENREDAPVPALGRRIAPLFGGRFVRAGWKRGAG